MAVPSLTTKDSVVLLLYAFLAALPAWYLTAYLISPLRRVPGPFLAGWTNLWRMFHVRQGKYHVVIADLHKKYGPVVRIAPNVLDLDFPQLIKTLYNTKANYLKTEFYHGSSAKNNGKIIYNLFSECNPEVHARQKRPIAQHYSMTGVLPLEPHIDQMIGYLCERLEEKFINDSSSNKTCDLGEWIAFYTWDVVGKATFSQPIGYLEKGHDFDGTLATADIAMDYFTMVGQMPILDHLLDKNPVYRIGPPSFGNITNISIQHLMDRLQGKDGDYHDPQKPDFLDKFIEAKEKFPDVVNDMQIISYLMINMIAGADTTGITLNAALYFSLKNPRVWSRLRSEIPAYDPTSTNSVVSFKHARECQYLEAVVREAMRCHPAVAMLLERYVPEGGLTLPTGQCIPAGCVVGMNPYILGRNKSVWGEDAEEFRPERWLWDDSQESQEEFQERLRVMNNADLAFGGGSRVCIGKNLALLEVYKVLATLVSRYDMKLAQPDKNWATHNSFFVRQEDIKVKISRRY
ncbi:cytochrome protein [Penicillium macrosclerotiorum]|uniref:cytochrome protein n=1 Tax=Penicillium macrosclerotiorum TaxID=303699 RepID=UPI0025468178|nr:cytochrome protein [Penicillium macrosclerotiorum]KAJ5683485.1 cytochrome protein [Penicillium macrosclerotiorum]